MVKNGTFSSTDCQAGVLLPDRRLSLARHETQPATNRAGTSFRLGVRGLAVVLFWLQAGCLVFHGQRYTDFTVARPLPETEVLVLGFVGGREKWNNPGQGVRRLALRLARLDLPIQVETVENQKRQLALQLVRDAFDRNRDGVLDPAEKKEVRLILYGQSFGGAAVVKLARQLWRQKIPVLLTVQIDSVGRRDGRIPPNVERAANLYQSDGILIKGQSRIRAQDPKRTRILGNFRFRYKDRKIDLSGVSFWKKVFRKAHTQMGLDPEVWSKVEELIVEVAR